MSEIFLIIKIQLELERTGKGERAEGRVWGNEKRMKKRSRRERKDERGEKRERKGERREGEEKRNEKKRGGIPSVFQFKHCLKDVFRCILVLFFLKSYLRETK